MERTMEQLCEEYFLPELIAYNKQLQKDEAPHDFSPEFEHKMQTLLAQQDAPDNRKRLFTWVTILLAAALAGSSLAALQVDPPPAIQFCVQTVASGTRLSLTQTDAQAAQKTASREAPTWLPQGYVPDTTAMNMSSDLLAYRNSAGDFLHFRQCSTSAATWLDADPSQLEQETVQGAAGYFIDLGDFSVLTWQDGATCYEMVSSISKNELQKIAESVK